MSNTYAEYVRNGGYDVRIDDQKEIDRLTKDNKTLSEELEALEQEACHIDDEIRRQGEKEALYYVALNKCADRYDQWTDVLWFREGIEARLPLEKLNRWLGFIQGTVVAAGHTTVQIERDWTRSLFRPLDFPQ